MTTGSVILLYFQSDVSIFCSNDTEESESPQAPPQSHIAMVEYSNWNVFAKKTGRVAAHSQGRQATKPEEKASKNEQRNKQPALYQNNSLVKIIFLHDRRSVKVCVTLVIWSILGQNIYGANRCLHRDICTQKLLF